MKSTTKKTLVHPEVVIEQSQMMLDLKQIKSYKKKSCEAAISSYKIAEGGQISSASEAIGFKIGHFEISGQDYDISTKENPLNSKGRKC